MHKYPCHCCGYKTLDKPLGSHAICPICFWEDDKEAVEFPFDAGSKISLFDAQSNYIKYGASDEKYISKVRKPNENDIKDYNWERLREI